METEVLAAASATDFSFWALFVRATVTVKLVMIVLVVASVWSWAIIVQKHINFRKARAEADEFEDAFWSGTPLDEVFDEVEAEPRDGAEKIFVAGMREWRRSHANDGGLIAGAQARIDRAMNVAIAREQDEITRGLGVLATVGSISPFVGLFGTVWGIKHSFEEIAIQQSTNLAVVAPGIAEALLATAIGLLAAIPAVVFYNKLSSDADAIGARYDSFAEEFSVILSRQLEAREA
ncbi:protein TolQ [Halovulum dunhuangense]|uniref:Tol-Pal system protein TolQ n=1 Tax=Halovulum dunhuangense TaxID=1505036 RepID=A0A849L4I1_9RHOB|nr:protein TolQ [Halovulum dunhuangense]NNU81266.1 protein TolQ [Halovulum dunhuangense]